MNKKYAGFTLIELLIVVVILGILSGLTMNVINTGRQRRVAEDAVRRTNMEKLSQSLEAFCTAEDKCPTAAEINSYSSPPVSVYLQNWPTSTFGSAPADNKYYYYPDDQVPPKNFEVSIKMMTSTTTTKYLRYNSTWGQIMECTNVISAAFSTPVAACAAP